MIGYFYLAAAVFFGILSNNFAKISNGYEKFIPTSLSAISIVIAVFFISKVMKFLPMGIAYASYAGLVIFGTFMLSIIKFGQSPNLFGILGCGLIILGIVMVNTLGK